jgi:hypothetical protein
MGKVRKVMLEDPIPSAQQLDHLLRDLLWGMVEYISHNSTVDNNLPENPISDEYTAFHEEIDAYGLSGQIPVFFSSSKKRKRARMLSQHDQPSSISSFALNGQVLKLPSCQKPVFENIYRLRDTSMSNTCVMIIGLSSKPDHMRARKQASGEVIDIAMSQLVAVPKESLASVYTQHFCVKDSELRPHDVSIHPKYWDQRYRLMSRYDQGIILDEESWYSITPEAICDYLTLRCQELFDRYHPSKRKFEEMIVLDLFAGCGGNVISFASKAFLTIAVDIDPIKSAACR